MISKSVPLRIVALFALLAVFAFLAPRLPSANAESGYVLAVSWQPAFCETRPRVRECRSQKDGRADTRLFSLHGLWPQPVSKAYCGVPQAEIDADKAGRWRDIGMERLPDALWNRLRTAMPGTASHLDRHEWLKHGTCMAGVDPVGYFEKSLALLEALNGTPVRDLFAANIGRRLTGNEIRAAFDETFGAGAGKRVRIVCVQDGNRRLISELTLGLTGEIGRAPDLAALIAAARPTDPGCPGGIVDPAGLQ
ncbi:MAG: ribonuclease [Nitratireductor sp.]|nr:ribonuclease [Nitratireductor sp.]